MSGRRKKFKAPPPTKEETARLEKKEIEKARIMVSIQQARDEVTAGKRLINLAAILHIICSCGFSRETIVACSTCKDLWGDDFHLQQVANKIHRDPQGGSMNRVAFCIGTSGRLGGTRNVNSYYYSPAPSASRDALVAARLQRLIAAGATVNRIGTGGYYSRPPLGLAVGRGLTECVRLLCSQPGLEVNTKYERRPPIVMAVTAVNPHQQPDMEIVRILLAMPDMDVNLLDEVDGSSALSVACQRAHPTDPAIVRMLLEVEGIDVNIGSPPPLCHAVKTSNNVVFELLTSRPEIDPNTAGDSRPLVLAIESKNANFVTVLLSLPTIDINAISQVRTQDQYDHYGYHHNRMVQTTPLMAACKNVDLPIVRLLCARAGILINAATTASTALIQVCESFTAEPDRLTLLQLLLEQAGIDVNLRVGGKSPLSAAAAAKDKGAFLLLMQQPGIVVRVNVLSEACKAGAGGHGDVVLAVLATPDLYPEGGYNTRARTLAQVVSQSCQNNHREILSALLPLPDIVVTRHDIMSAFRMGNAGVGTLLTEWEGFSQFNFSQASLITMLYQQQQSVRIGRTNIRSPLPGCIEILKGLMRRKDYDVEASYDQAEYACLQGYHNAVAAFVAHPDYDINHVRKVDGATLVMIAAGKKLVEVVRVLVKVPGIDLNIKDDVGNTAIYYASLDTKGNTPVQALLISHGAVEDGAPDGRSRRGRVLKAVKR